MNRASGKPQVERQRLVRRLIWRAILFLPPSARLFLWRLAIAVLPAPLRRVLRRRVMRKESASIPLTLSLPGETPASPDPTKRARPMTFDVVVLPTVENGPAAERSRELARRFVRDGHRVFAVRAVSGDGGWTVRQTEPGWFQVDVGVPAKANGAPTALDDTSRATVVSALTSLGEAYRVVDAVSLVERSDWEEVARNLDDRLGWKVVREPDAVDASPGIVDWDEIYATTRPALLARFPRVSIVVLTYNLLDYTRLCLQSIYEKTTYPNVEVIVVDNNSGDGTQSYLTQFAAEHPTCQVILSPANEGYARGNNHGIKAATGEYIVLLNNDTVVTPPWLSRMIHHLRDQTIGIVGPVTNWSGRESQIETSYQNLVEMETFAEEYTRAHAGESFEVAVLVFFCAMIPRRVYEEVGLLDETFTHGIGSEDGDYALRVRGTGRRLVCARDVFIHHWGNATFSTLFDGKEHLRLIEKNRREFEKKWGTKSIKWDRSRSASERPPELPATPSPTKKTSP